MRLHRICSITVLIGVLLFAGCQKREQAKLEAAPAPSAASELPEGGLVDLCDILRSPEIYENKPVRFKAYYCDCFEAQSIYPSKCEIDKKIWVQGSRDQKCKEAGRIDPFRSASADLPEATYGSWTFGVIGEGRLIGTKGGYGHMNAFDYLFEIGCLEHAELLDKKGRRPGDISGGQQKVAAFEAMK